jgi:hypothetical protein
MPACRAVVGEDAGLASPFGLRRVMVVVGWIIEAAVKWAVGWFIGTILKVKLGG